MIPASTGMAGGSGPGRLSDPRAVAGSVLFVALLVAAIADLLGGSTFVGAPLASAIVWPAAGILLGLAAYRAGREGAAPILTAAAIIALAVTGGEWVDPAMNGFRDPPGGLATPAIAAALAIVTVLASATMRRRVTAGTAGIVHTTANRATALALVSLGLIDLLLVLANSFRPGGIENVASLSDGIQIVVSLVRSDWVAALAIGLVAWWYGSGWLLVLSGLSTLALIASVPLAALTPAAIPGVLAGIGSVAAGLRPPGGHPMLEAVRRGHRSLIRPTAAAVWALSGSLLLVPTLPIGLWMAQFGDCFGNCPPMSPLLAPAGFVDLVLIVLLPFAASAVAFAPTTRTAGRAARVGVAGAALVLVQVALGELEARGFEYMDIAAPAATLALLGFGAAAWRPAGLGGTGPIAALAIALLALIWIAASAVGEFGIEWPSHLGAIVAAGVAAVALAMASGESAPPASAAPHPANLVDDRLDGDARLGE